MNHYRFVIHLKYNEALDSFQDPIYLELETRWDDGAKELVKELLTAYPNWEYYTLERQEWTTVQRGLRTNDAGITIQ